uniref:DNA topoisomerase n=1 Tax=viral metagenome TaxID=1070528 RepID=A0A6C0IW76_9ZZZZ
MVILVIVESPSKCKKIEEYLGPGYKVMASFGHLRILDGLESIDINNQFRPKYTLAKETIKLKQIEKLRTEINNASDVILACDDDREGESICWHICDLFDLSVSSTKRIIFHEITETAIKKAIYNPTKINMDLVHAQQARQILDLLVGFTITPILWGCISKKHDGSLSAGRCQTPALRLIYENYLDIQKNIAGKEVYNVTGYFTNLNLLFELNTQFTCKQDTQDFLNKCINYLFKYEVSLPKKTIRKSPEPLTTSNLQQLANNEIHMSPKETMKYAQELYEAGYITYMRTDTKKYSIEFINLAKEYIKIMYGEQYISQTIDLLALNSQQQIQTQIQTQILKNNDKKTKSTNNANANTKLEPHEAIRPVKINQLTITDETISQKAKKLYELIWKRTLESCMPSAQYNVISAKMNAPDNLCFVYKCEQVIFPGWQVVKKEYEEVVKAFSYLQLLEKNTDFKAKKIEAKFSLVELKSHYSEAHLVKLLEDKGIGRPSTFASLIDKIQERKYVEKKNIDGREITNDDFILEDNNTITIISNSRTYGNEKNKLVITSLGILVIEFLLDKFDTFFNYEYTQNMENTLDQIAKGESIWYQLCETCHSELHLLVKDIKTNKFCIQIGDNYSLIIGKHGPVVKHIDANKNVSFLPVKKDLNLKELETKSQTNNIVLEDILENKEGANRYEPIGKYKGHELFIKKGKFGLYAQWETNKVSLKGDLGSTPIEKIQYIDVLRFLEKYGLLDTSKPIGLVRELIGQDLSIRNGKYGDYIYYKKPRVKKPEFYKLNGFKGDCRTCDKDLLINWIKQTYKF